MPYGKLSKAPKKNVFSPKKGQPFSLPYQKEHSVLGERGRALGSLARALRASKTKGFPAKKAKPGALGYQPRVKKLRMDRIRKEIAAVKPDKQTSIPSTDFDKRYRADAPFHDELWSTAAAREFLKGFFKSVNGADLTAGEIEWINDKVNRFSDLRIPTRYSGFARAGEVMQHPTSPDAAVFGEVAATAFRHASYDVERRAFVIRAMETAGAQTQDADEIVSAGMQAAIEYTLNYFTAPASAGNVFNFTRAKLKNHALTVEDSDLRAQVAARELMKEIYVRELGGSLRQSIAGETSAQSLRRFWQGRPTSIGLPLADPQAGQLDTLRQPPSPRRGLNEPGFPAV